jgi:hypothetical protein
LKVALNVPAVAVTVTGPGVPPAVTVTEASPAAFVVALVAPSVAGPLTEKLTVAFCTAFPEGSTTRTTSGAANAVLICALWPPPLTAVSPPNGMLTVTLKLPTISVLLMRTRTWCVPAAPPRVTVVETRPVASDVLIVLLSVAPLGFDTDQVTPTPARGLPP